MNCDEYERPSAKKVPPVGCKGHRGRKYSDFLVAIHNMMAPRDLLEILLYSSIRVRDTRDTAVRAMARFDDHIDDVLHGGKKELISVHGIGVHSALLIRLIGRIIDQLNASPVKEDAPVFETLYDVGEYLKAHANVADRELWFLSLNSEGRLNFKVKIADGIPTASPEEMKQILQLAARSQKTVLALMAPTNKAVPDHYTIGAAQKIHDQMLERGYNLWDFILADPTEAIPFRECSIIAYK